METIYSKRIANAGKKMIYGIVITFSTFGIGGLKILVNGYRSSIEGVTFACLSASAISLFLQLSAAKDLMKCTSEPTKFI